MGKRSDTIKFDKSFLQISFLFLLSFPLTAAFNQIVFRNNLINWSQSVKSFTNPHLGSPNHALIPFPKFGNGKTRKFGSEIRRFHANKIETDINAKKDFEKIETINAQVLNNMKFDSIEAENEYMFARLDDYKTRRKACSRLFTNRHRLGIDQLKILTKNMVSIGNFTGTRELLTLLRKEDTKSNDISFYEDLLRISGKRKYWQMSLILLKEMKIDRLPISEFQMNFVVKTCLKHNQLGAALNCIRNINVNDAEKNSLVNEYQSSKEMKNSEQPDSNEESIDNDTMESTPSKGASSIIRSLEEDSKTSDNQNNKTIGESYHYKIEDYLISLKEILHKAIILEEPQCISNLLTMLESLSKVQFLTETKSLGGDEKKDIIKSLGYKPSVEIDQQREDIYYLAMRGYRLLGYEEELWNLARGLKSQGILIKNWETVTEMVLCFLGTNKSFKNSQEAIEIFKFYHELMEKESPRNIKDERKATDAILERCLDIDDQQALIYFCGVRKELSLEFENKKVADVKKKSGTLREFRQNTDLVLMTRLIGFFISRNKDDEIRDLDEAIFLFKKEFASKIKDEKRDFRIRTSLVNRLFRACFEKERYEDILEIHTMLLTYSSGTPVKVSAGDKESSNADLKSIEFEPDCYTFSYFARSCRALNRWRLLIDTFNEYYQSINDSKKKSIPVLTSSLNCILLAYIELEEYEEGLSRIYPLLLLTGAHGGGDELELHTRTKTETEKEAKKRNKEGSSGMLVGFGEAADEFIKRNDPRTKSGLQASYGRLLYLCTVHNQHLSSTTKWNDRDQSNNNLNSDNRKDNQLIKESKKNNAIRAWNLFQQMRTLKLEINELNYLHILLSLSDGGMPDMAKEVLHYEKESKQKHLKASNKQLTEKSIELASIPPVNHWNSVIHAYMKIGDLNGGLEVFNNLCTLSNTPLLLGSTSGSTDRPNTSNDEVLVKPDIVTFNILIAGLELNHKPKRAVDLAKDMEDTLNLAPDIRTFASLLWASGKMRNAELSNKISSRIDIKDYIETELHSILSLNEKNTEKESSDHTFDGKNSIKGKLNELHRRLLYFYEAKMYAFTHSNDNNRKSLSILDEMKDINDFYLTLTSELILKYVESNGKDVEKEKKALTARPVRYIVPTTRIYNDALYGCRRNIIHQNDPSYADKALDIYYEMNENRLLLEDRLLRVKEKSSKTDDRSTGEEEQENLIEENRLPDSTTYLYLFQCLKQAMRYQDIVQIGNNVELMEPILMSDYRVAKPFLTALVKEGNFGRAESLIDTFVKELHAAIAFNKLNSASILHFHEETEVPHLSKFPRKILMDVYRWTTMFYCTQLTSKQTIEKAKALLDDINDYSNQDKVYADASIYRSLMNGYLLREQYDEVIAIYNQLSSTDSDSYNKNNLSPDIHLLTIEAYFHQGRLEMAKSLLNSLKDDIAFRKNQSNQQKTLSKSKASNVARPSILRCLNAFCVTIRTDEPSPNLEKSVFIMIIDIMKELEINVNEKEQEKMESVLSRKERYDYLPHLQKL